MMEVSSSSIKTEEEDENELSLELSIGRNCYNNKTSTTSLPQKSIDLGIIDLPLKREIQALRRQEARKKRDEKLKFKSTLSCRGAGGGDQNGNVSCVINHEDHAVVDEDEGDDDDDDDDDDEEEEEEAEMPPRKKEKCQSFSYNNLNSVVLNVGPKEEKEKEKLLVRDFDLKMNQQSGLMGEPPCPYPTLPAMQYMPFTNRFVYHPHGVIPSCLGSVVACANGFMDKDKMVSFGNGTGVNESLGKDKRVSFDTAACRSFRPYGRNIEMNVVNGKSDASSGGSSPAVSDHHNSSLQGGSSSINFPQESRNAFIAGYGPKKSDIRRWDSMGMVSNEVRVQIKANDIVNMTSSTNIQDRESMHSEELKPAAPLRNPTLSTKNPIDPALLKKETSNAVITSPLKPQTECNGASHLPKCLAYQLQEMAPMGKPLLGSCTGTQKPKCALSVFAMELRSRQLSL